MRSIPLAMLWELVYCGRWHLVTGLFGGNVFPLILLTALKNQGALDPTELSLVVLQMIMVQISMFIFGAGAMSAQRNLARLYPLPITNTTIAACQLLPMMALTFVYTAGSTWMLNLLFGLQWPLWGPALFGAVAIAAVQAALWQSDKSGWIIFFMTGVGAILGLWYKSRHGAMFSHPEHTWDVVTPVEYLTLFVMGILAFYAAVIGVARMRRGDTLRSFGIVAWIERVLDPAPEDGLPFSTPLAAQSWAEWRVKGWAMPCAAIFAMVLAVGAWLTFSRDIKELLQGTFAGGFMLMALALVIGLVMGNTGPNDRNFQMGNFYATRPLTNSDLARTILKTAARSVWLTWMIWFVAFLSLYGLCWATRSLPTLKIPEELGWWYLPLTLIGPWMIVGVGTSFGLTGRSWMFVSLICIPITLFVLGSLWSQYALSFEGRMQFGAAVFAALGLVFVPASAWLMYRARRGRLIGTRTVVIAAICWTMLSLLVLVSWMQYRTNPEIHVFAVGLAALAVVPVASAPLALAWNRTR